MGDLPGTRPKKIEGWAGKAIIKHFLFNFEKLPLKKVAFLVLLIPIIAYSVFTLWVKPGPFYLGYDPEMPYLFNSLAIFKGQTYTYIDHPGTPVEVIGSVILGLTYPFARNFPGGFIDFHLNNPALFVSLSHSFLILASIFCAWYFYSTAMHLFPNLGLLLPLAAAGLFYVLTPISFQTLSYWSHNSFNFPFGTLYLLVLLRIIYQAKGELRRRETIGLGLAGGILAAVQIYFAVWVISTAITIFVFYTLQGLPRKTGFLAALGVLISGMVGFAICLIPMAPLIPVFINWVIALIFHQGRYGGGPEGILSLNGLVENFAALVNSATILFIASGVVFGVLIYLFSRKNRQTLQKPGFVAMSIGLFCQVAFLFILILKHPGTAYLLSVAATLPVLFLVVAQNGAGKINPLARKLFFILVMAGFLFNFVQAALLQEQTVDDTQAVEKETVAAIADDALITHRKAEDLVILWTYGAFSPCQALRFGDGYAGGIFRPKINNLCRNQYQLDIWKQMVETPGGWVGIKEIPWDLLVTRKRIYENEDYSFLKALGDSREYPVSDNYGNLLIIRPEAGLLPNQ